jgi:uncharacterized protein (TIGR02217 family)
VPLASFDEVQFPPRISAGAQGGPAFSTTVLTLDSGMEHRNINWSRERPTYDISTGLKDADDGREYLKFFYARRGKAIGFRFKDWSDFRLPFWIDTPGDLDPQRGEYAAGKQTGHWEVWNDDGEKGAENEGG